MSINLGIIGCGNISHYHSEGLRILRTNELEHIKVQAVCDIIEEKARNLAIKISNFQRERPKVYSNFKTMLEKEDDIDAIDICTDHRSHHKIAIPCLEAGKHVIIEKPLGITMRACKRLNEVASRRNVVLATAENNRRTIVNRTINWALRKGMIGDPRLIVWQELSYDLGIVDKTPWRHDKMRAGGGWILDVGSHLGDLFIYNLGEVEEIYGKIETLEPIHYNDWPVKKKPIKCTVEDTSSAILKFKNGVLGQWTWTKSAPGIGLLHRAIYGNRGSINWKSGLKTLGSKDSKDITFSIKELARMMISDLNDDEKQKYFPKGIGKTFDASFFSRHASFAAELLDFAEAILLDRKPEVDGILGAKDEAIPMAIFESSWLDEPVKVCDIEDCRIENYQAEINEALGIE